VFAHEMCSIPGLGHDSVEIVIPRGIGGTLSLSRRASFDTMVPQIVPAWTFKDGYLCGPADGLLDLTYVRPRRQGLNQRILAAR
jgi:hypothetical protein